MNIDVIRESANLPLLNMGDHLVIHNVGAYNMTQWMQFITLRPNVVLIDMDRETTSDQNQGIAGEYERHGADTFISKKPGKSVIFDN